MNSKMRARLIVLVILIGVIVLGYWLGPMVLDLFLEMHGIGTT